MNELWQVLSLKLGNMVNAVDLKIWGGKVLLILLIIVAAQLTISLSYVLVERLFKVRPVPGSLHFDEKRARTLMTIMKSVIKYSVYFIAIITVLDELNVPITAVLSAAGILGLAVGFGAQNLVKDVITGFFILFENQFSVGEYIETEGFGGVVEEVGLRVTKLRDWSGELHIIPNGRISVVTNHNRGSMRALVEVGIAYEADLERALLVLKQIAAGVARDLAPVITDGPDVLGVTKLDDSAVVIRIVAKTLPLEQWGVERELLKRIKEAFDKEGIEIPYPRRYCIIAGQGGQKDERGEDGA